MLKKTRILFIVVLFALSSLSFVSLQLGNHFEIAKNLELFASIFRELNSHYVDELEPEKLIRKGINAMLGSLDPYTSFISEEDMGSYKMQTTGKYGGIGALIRQSDDYVIIAEPYEGFPAYKAGLQAGDKIVEIEGKSGKGKTTSDVSKLLKGKPNTDVTIKIERMGVAQPMTKVLRREEIKLESVPFSGMVSKDVGYIRLTNFTEKCSKEVSNKLKELQKDHQAKSLILDLRGNPGGLLSEAIDVVNVFVDKSKQIVSTKSKKREWDKIYRSKNRATDTEIPLVVLIDRGSASASEIVSGVMQDLDRGIVIGTRSFGKGLVQTTKNVGYNSKIKLTTAKYYLPSGRCIQAIDYSGGYNDKLEKVPDSLRTSFSTLTNKRKVYDSGGIDPDIEVKGHEYSNITASLMSKQHIFNYATQYRSKHSSLAQPKSFELTDTDFNDFVRFLGAKEYDYVTESEQLLKDLRKSAEKEKYLTAIQQDLQTLESQIKHDKNKDLSKFKTEIEDLLEQEIVSRYHYQKGRIEEMLEEDPAVKKAISILSNSSEYQQLLRK